jgi:acetyl esterase
MAEMPGFFGYMVLALFLLCGVAGAAIYRGTFGPDGRRIDPRFVVFFKYVQWTARYDRGTLQERRVFIDRLMLFAARFKRPLPGLEIKDATVPTPTGDLRVRIYDPAAKAPADRRPLMLFLHGGGFFSGSIETHDRVCQLLASKSQAVVVSVGYRLAPEHPFPAGVDDAYQALLWASVNAQALKTDPDRLIVAGDSAGGNLAAALTLRARAENGPRIAYQILIYPLLEMAHFDSETLKTLGGGGFFLTRETMMKMRHSYLAGADASGPYASPLLVQDLRGLPPALVLTAEFDPLRSEGEAYAEKLNAQGVPARLRRFPGLGHGFFSMSGMIPQAVGAFDEIAAVLKTNL